MVARVAILRSSPVRAVTRRVGAARRRAIARLGGPWRLTPASRYYGLDRGTPVDRHYIDDFLRRHSAAEEYSGGLIRGRVLEFGDDAYARRFAPTGSHIDVMHAEPGHPAATVVGDLVNADGLPSDMFDCIICTQVLNSTYEIHVAVKTLARLLRPGGTVLATVPGICAAARPDADLWGDYWRFTERSARRLFEEAFPAENVHVEAYGNLLSSMAFLAGLAAEEMTRHELEPRDPDYQVAVCIRALRPV